MPGRGYRYYGAAKKLPGVKELFSRAAPERAKRTRFEMMKGIDADYYGYRDDDDGVLAELEAAAEPGLLAAATDRWREAQEKRRQVDPEGVAAEAADLAAADAAGGGAGDDFTAHVEVPDQEAIKHAILARRKQDLLSKLASQGGAEALLEPEGPRVETLETLKRLPPSW